jgi:hypothetical protein
MWHPIERAQDRSVAAWFTRESWSQTLAMLVAVSGVLAFGVLVLKLIGA